MVQPMLAKLLLPYVGGAPGVWISSMLFFQLVLLAGYGYAALGSAYLSPRKQIFSHLALLVIALLVSIPVRMNMLSEPGSGSSEWWVMNTLLFSVGLPYFLLTANASLMQRWYHHSFNHSPYYLFSISNIGSFAGLLGYPLLVEWLLPTGGQMLVWSGAFVLLACLILFMALRAATYWPDGGRQSLGKAISKRHAVKTVFLGFVPSSLFLSVTLYITTDIASFPMLWVVPLGLYLLSFVIAFSRYGECWTQLCQKLHLLAFTAVICALFFSANITLIALHLVMFFIIAMSCHGQVAREKPEPERLTAFFFWLSLGGALGGLFNVLVPYMLDNIYEYHAMVLLSIFALPANKAQIAMIKRAPKRILLIFAGMALLIASMWSWELPDDSFDGVLFQERNFFGVTTVKKTEQSNVLIHGTTMHGYQLRNEDLALIPTSYYIPVFQIMNQMPDSFFQRPFAVLGLGAGSLACLGKTGQVVDFYEIDQVIIDVARDSSLFTYLRNCSPESRTLLGDGRLEIAKQPDAQYNLIVADAFSSDAVPVHLLTKEALGLYISKLNPDGGMLLFNISNRYLDLRDVVATAMRSYGYETYYLRHIDDPNTEYDVRADWMFALPKYSPWENILLEHGAQPYMPHKDSPLWTDDYSHILPLFKALNPESK